MDPKIFSVKPGKSVHDRLGDSVEFSGKLSGLHVFLAGGDAQPMLLTEQESTNLASDGWEINEPKAAKKKEK